MFVRRLGACLFVCLLDQCVVFPRVGVFLLFVGRCVFVSVVGARVVFPVVGVCLFQRVGVCFSCGRSVF